MAKEKRVSNFVKFECPICKYVQDHVGLDKVYVKKRCCHYCGWDELKLHTPIDR